MRKLVLLRHGESVWNAENKFTGWVDIPLSENGIKQAEEAGKLLRELGFVFDIVFTSVLQRSIQTAKIVLGEAGLKDASVIESQSLNERHYGALQGMGKKEAVEQFGEGQVKIWRRGFSSRPPAINKNSKFYQDKAPLTESLQDVVLRVGSYWDKEIAPCVRAGKKVLVSAHGNSLRALIKLLDKISDVEIEKLNIPVGMPLVYELNENLEPVKSYYLGDSEKAKLAMEAVANEAKI